MFEKELHFFEDTPLKINMEPKKLAVCRCVSFFQETCSGSMLIFEDTPHVSPKHVYGRKGFHGNSPSGHGMIRIALETFLDLLLQCSNDIPEILPSLPKSPKYLVSRCLDPLKAFSGGVCGSKHLLTRYLED